MARTCHRTLQVDGSSEFDQLAGDILYAFDFDFDHLYEFRTKLRNVEGNITYSLDEDYVPMTFGKTVLKILRKKIPQMRLKIVPKKQNMMIQILILANMIFTDH